MANNEAFAVYLIFRQEYKEGDVLLDIYDEKNLAIRKAQEHFMPEEEGWMDVPAYFPTVAEWKNEKRTRISISRWKVKDA